MPQVVDGAVPKLVIQEITGDERLVELSQRALPFRPITFKRSQRKQIDWYPGSDVASLQILGPEEGETTIKGAWHDRYIMKGGYDIVAPGLTSTFASTPNEAPALLDGEPVANIHDLVDLFDDICGKGQLLSVTWGSISRFGIMSDFEQTWLTDNDVEWSVGFSWISRDQDPTQARVLVQTADTTNLAQSSQQSLGQVLQATSAAAFAVANDVQVAISDATEQAQSTINQIQSTVENGIEAITAPLDAAKSLVALTENLADSYAEVMDFSIERVQEFTDFGDYITRYAKSLAARSAARSARDSAAVTERALLNQIDPEIIGTVVARDGMDLRDISTQFYRTPDSWPTLMSYNALTSSKLTAGMLILVPKRTS